MERIESTEEFENMSRSISERVDKTCLFISGINRIYINLKRREEIFENLLNI